MSDTPTNRQLEMLRHIAATTLVRKFPPSIRELCDALDYRSTNGVNDVLRALERKGLLTRQTKTARSLVLTKNGLSWCSAEAA